MKGYNAITGAKVKLGSWPDYLAMRCGMLRLNAQLGFSRKGTYNHKVRRHIAIQIIEGAEGGDRRCGELAPSELVPHKAA